MELIKLAQSMSERIKLLSTKRDELSKLATTKANSIGMYEKSLALTMMKLKNGVEMELEGEKIVNPISSIAERLAKGICWQEKINMEEAEAKYKIALASMECIKAELNGLQSINRHLKEEV